MVDIAVVEYEHASRARVWVGEGNDKFLEELKEAICSDRARDNVVGDNDVDSEDGEDGKKLPLNKKPVLDAASSHGSPAFASSRCAAIASSLVDKHEHVRVGDDVCNLVHIGSSEDFIPFQSSYGDTLATEVEAAECS